MRLSGRAARNPDGRRTALNFLAHLSGIATLTRRFVEQLEGTNAKSAIRERRSQGLRMPEKYAVRMGAGRITVSDSTTPFC